MSQVSNIKNFSEIYPKYKGLWVALTEKEDRVVSSGKDLKAVFNEAKKKGIKTPILFKVPEKILGYVGSNLW